MDGEEGTQVYIPSSGADGRNVERIRDGQITAGIAVVLNGSAYFMGGSSGRTDTKVVTVFNPATRIVSITDELRQARYGVAATSIDDEFIIACGGFNYPSSAYKTCEQYSLETALWSSIEDLPQSTSFAAMATLNRRAYVFGGSPWDRDDGADACGNTDAVFMFDGHKWNSRMSMPTPLRSMTALAINPSHALICGGGGFNDGSCVVTNKCYIYSADGNTWDEAQSLSEPRWEHIMVMLNGLYFSLQFFIFLL
jgi:hypothetical protein